MMTSLLLTGIGAGFLVSELALARSRRAATTQADGRDRGSLRLLWLVISAAVTAGIVVDSWGPRLPAATQWVGVAVFGAGAALRWWAIRHLGRFTVDVAVAADHRVVSDGPYRYVRHPSYTGLLLEFIGFALVPAAVLTPLVMLPPIFLALWYRIRVEETALRAGLGEEYEAYSRRTKRLVPGVL